MEECSASSLRRTWVYLTILIFSLVLAILFLYDDKKLTLLNLLFAVLVFTAIFFNHYYRERTLLTDVLLIVLLILILLSCATNGIIQRISIILALAIYLIYAVDGSANCPMTLVGLIIPIWLIYLFFEGV